MMAVLKKAVLRVLSALSDHALTSHVHHLGDCGVEKESDLQFVEESDLEELLKPIQCRKLSQAWRKQGNTILTGSKFCVTFDGHAVAEVPGPFVKGFALLVASFYIETTRNCCQNLECLTAELFVYQHGGGDHYTPEMNERGTFRSDDRPIEPH